MQIKEVIHHLETLAPMAYAEDFDNVGLLVGDPKTKVSGILVTLDTLESVVDEAIEKKCNLIVSFHPIVFKGIKKFNGKNYVQRVVMKAIKYDIAIFAIHTALDNAFNGVNNMICEKIGLINRQILIPQKKSIKKLITFVPKEQSQKLLEHLFEAGAGTIGNYDQCSFSSDGMGSFRPSENADPSIGEKGKLHRELETQLQITYPKHKEQNILSTLFATHPYEEVAYEISSLENTNQHIGMGMIGELPKAVDDLSFLKHIKKVFNCGAIRHSALLNQPIKKVAVLGGSGSFAIPNAIQQKADIFITADLKYHQFYEAEEKLVLADIGHYESEAKKEVTVEQKLRALYDLQLIDSRVDEIRNVRGELPLEVEDLEDEVAGLNKRLEKLSEDLEIIDDGIKTKKNLIEEAKALIKKYGEQQKNVRNNREFNSLSKEVEFQELEIQLAEKNIKEFKAQIVQKNEIIDQTKQKSAERKEHLSHKKGELDAILAETEKEELALISKSENYQKDIEDRLVTAYKRIRKNVKNGLAVVPIERGASGGSFFTIPPQVQMEIASRKKIITDEHSGRILVDQELAREQKEKMQAMFAKL